MKKILMCIPVLFLSAFLQAQKGIGLGLNVQPHVAYVLSSSEFDSPDTDPLPISGFALEFAADYNFTDKIGISTGLGFSRQGWLRTPQSGGLAYDFEFLRLDYLTMPIMFKFNSSTERRVQFLFNVGPELGFLMNAESDRRDNLWGNSTVDIKSQINDLDVAMRLGLGLQIRLTDYLFIHGAWSLKMGALDLIKDDRERYVGYNILTGFNTGIKYVIRMD